MTFVNHMKTVCAVVFCLVSSVQCPVSVFAQDPAMQQQFKGFNLVGYADGGEKEWDINGDQADVQGSKVDIVNVDANSYGQENMNVKARKGILDKQTGDVELHEDVVITSESGTQMKTDYLQWRRDEDLVETDDVVTLEEETMTLKGRGMQAHPNLKTAQLNKEIEAEIDTNNPETKGKSTISIVCDGPMEIDQARQIAIFRNNVVAIEKETGRTLKADMMQVYFDPETQQIRQVVCTGNVSVQQEENITYSESLIYKVDEQRMVLSGRPQLIFSTDKSSSQFSF